MKTRMVISVVLLVGVANVYHAKTTTPPPPTPSPTTPPPTTLPPPTTTAECQEWDSRGDYGCSFICGLNNQWYRQNMGGGVSPEAQHCGTAGTIVEAKCPEICVEGRWQIAPCYRCCQEYPDNHCDITCNNPGLEVEWGCDPFSPPTTAPTTTPQTTTS